MRKGALGVLKDVLCEGCNKPHEAKRVDSLCPECKKIRISASKSAYRFRNLDELNQKERFRYAQNQFKEIERSRQKYKVRRNAALKQGRIRKLERIYGITEDEYNEMYALQKGKCAICFKNPATVVDHDHVTGKVRGLLCGKCNSGIGFLNDSLIIVEQALIYLRRHPEV